MVNVNEVMSHVRQRRCQAELLLGRVAGRVKGIDFHQTISTFAVVSVLL